MLRRRGFTDAAIAKVEDALADAEDLSQVFDRNILGDAFCQRMLGFTATELATSVAHQLDVTVLIHDDSAFGSIANYQMQRHGRTYATDLHNPDLVAFARSFGVPAERIDSILDLPAAMAKATSQPGPSVVVLVSPLRNPWV